MSFNSKNYYELREAFEQKHLAAAERAEARRTALASKIDGLSEIDDALNGTAARIMGAAFAGKEGLNDRIAEIRRETEESVKAALQYGCPMDYVLKDITTVSGNPQNLIVWAQTVSDVMDEYYGAD